TLLVFLLLLGPCCLFFATFSPVSLGVVVPVSSPATLAAGVPFCFSRLLLGVSLTSSMRGVLPSLLTTPPSWNTGAAALLGLPLSVTGLSPSTSSPFSP